MKKSLLSFFVLAIMLTLFSCGKDDNSSADDELIDAIIASEKQSVTESSLPSGALTVIGDEYSESFTEAALVATDLGYELNMCRAEGGLMGEKAQIYFNLDGKELRRARDRKKNGKNKRKGSEGCNREECFDIVFPVTVIMPDASEITGNSKQEIRTAMKEWFEENGPSEEHPSLQFPIDIVYEDGTVATVNSKEEIGEAYALCK